MDDIARKMGMSKKTLYQYINDKNKLVEESIMLAAKKDMEVMQLFKNKELNAIEQFFEFKKVMEPHIGQYQPTMLYDLKKYYPSLLQEFKNKQKDVVVDAYKSNMVQGKAEGYYIDDIDEDVISRLLFAHHVYTFDDTNSLFSSSELRDMRIFAELFKYHFRGICTPEGTEEVERLFCDNNDEQ